MYLDQTRNHTFTVMNPDFGLSFHAISANSGPFFRTSVLVQNLEHSDEPLCLDVNETPDT